MTGPDTDLVGTASPIGASPARALPSAPSTRADESFRVRLDVFYRRWFDRGRTIASILGALGYAASMSPSLLPRSWVLQGVISGLSMTSWYAAGTLVDKALHSAARWGQVRLTVGNARARQWVHGLWVGLLLVVVVAVPLASFGRQRNLARTMGLPEPTQVTLLAATALAIGVAAALTGVWALLRGLFRLVAGRMRSWPRALATPLATLLVAVLVLVIFQYGVLGGVLRIATKQSDATNGASPFGSLAPTSALLSGSPASGESWESLGFEGRRFVSRVTARDQIAQVMGDAVAEPIRVYAGRTTARSIEQTAAAAVAELDRTNAWERSALVIITTTGQGWVNPWSSSAIEFLTQGDCAQVAIQHSVLPSPLAFLDAPQRPIEAGEALLEAVEARWRSLPAQTRPKLYVTGESLGAYGGNAAFTSLDDLLDRVDGAVWTGTPSFTDLHEQITAARVLGSTQANPVVDDGRHVRFAANADQLRTDQFGRALGPWEFPRVVYFQHPSDPVVWWSPQLLFRTPAWLDETRTDTSTAQMSWLPIVTFWQITGDLPSAVEVPKGYGHNYHDEVVWGWSAVLDRGTPDQVRAIIATI